MSDYSSESDEEAAALFAAEKAAEEEDVENARLAEYERAVIKLRELPLSTQEEDVENCLTFGMNPKPDIKGIFVQHYHAKGLAEAFVVFATPEQAASALLRNGDEFCTKYGDFFAANIVRSDATTMEQARSFAVYAGGAAAAGAGAGAGAAAAAPAAAAAAAAPARMRPCEHIALRIEVIVPPARVPTETFDDVRIGLSETVESLRSKVLALVKARPSSQLTLISGGEKLNVEDTVGEKLSDGATVRAVLGRGWLPQRASAEPAAALASPAAPSAADETATHFTLDDILAAPGGASAGPAAPARASAVEDGERSSSLPSTRYQTLDGSDTRLVDGSDTAIDLTDDSGPADPRPRQRAASASLKYGPELSDEDALAIVAAQAAHSSGDRVRADEDSEGAARKRRRVSEAAEAPTTPRHSPRRDGGAAAVAAPSGPDLTDVVAVMAPENRRALEYIVTSAIRTNEADRQRAMAKLTAPSVANLDRIIEYAHPYV